MKEVYIVSVARTPIGSVSGSLSSMTAPELGAIAIKGAVERAKITTTDVQELFMGNVLTANVGQAPARQAALKAGLDNSVPCTTLNKVCASGMKAIMLGAQSIMLGDNDIVVAGGMESMSNTPYYLPGSRSGYRLGHNQVVDGIIKDGLWDVYNDYHMGNAAELCASECNISREDQDTFSIESYKRATAATESGKFSAEIVPVEIVSRKGTVVVSEDEDIRKVNYDKVPGLRPVFQKDGTVTAANASSINDGAAAVVLMSKERAEKMGIKPIAKIRSFADAAQAPEWFTTAPSKALPKALDKAGLKTSDVDYFEINEAFAVVSVANNKEMKLDPTKVNVNGGAVAMGHPIGCSGARIVVTLLSVLQQNKGKIGAAAICNGGGGASAIVVELV
ncbi:MAG: acetyl-CoA C-acetyltransferase [Sphingobacteriales bacterium]|jgi:acetyl-CoA C-acetyltransferase